MISIEELMTPNPKTLSPGHSLARLRELMRSEHIRHVPVVDDQQKLVGLVTERDALAAMDSMLETPDDESRRQNESMIKIESFMTRNPATACPSDSLRNAALFMEKHRYGCLPVIDAGKLVGIITDTDFVALAINLLEQQDALEPDD